MFAHMNDIGMNILTQVILWTWAVILVKDIIPYEIVGSEHMFSFSRYCQIVFPNGCTHSQSHQNFMRILVALYPLPTSGTVNSILATLVGPILEFI